MKKTRSKSKPSIKLAQPTKYSPTTASELRSVTLFSGLIDHNYIKGKPESMDKNPNDDGVFEFTLNDGTPIGKFAIQIKTLAKKDYPHPKYQCKLGFLAYCYQTNVPVILVAVNQQDCIIHWRHMDPTTLDEAQGNIRGQSVSIVFPPGNVIATGRQEYLAIWQNIVQQDVLLRRNADEHRRAHESLESDYKQLREQLSSPSMLSKEEIATFQRHLDRINKILDLDFPALKAIAYPDYWKIGVAVTAIAMGELSHFLIPIAYGSSELLVRQFEIISEKDILDVFHKKGAFVMIAGNKESIKLMDETNAYRIVKSPLLQAFRQAPLFAPYSVLANEYLVGFINTFFALFGLDRKDDPILLKELLFLLTDVLPVAYENELSFIAEGVNELSYGIDGYKDRSAKPYYKERIAKTKEILKSGYSARYRTQIYSTLFSIPLVYRYINFLIEGGQNEVCQVYAGDPLQRNHVPMHVGINNFPLISENLKRFFKQFCASYEIYLSTNFPNMVDVVDIFDGATLMVFVLQTMVPGAQKPYMECYRIHDARVGKRRILFYTDTDADNPIDRKRWLIDRDSTCTIFGQSYQITSLSVVTLEFLFERSPTYGFLNKYISKRLENFLEKKSTRTRQPVNDLNTHNEANI
jgi:hypothetical protein